LRIMKIRDALGAAAVLAALAAPPAASDEQTTAPAQHTLDVDQLFATTCGWCHSDGGRAAGKGPQLMNSARTDDFMRNRIKNGKEGAMPAFGTSFSDADIDHIIAYIRALKPE
jgi:mono/diheme cytochrome c family protein